MELLQYIEHPETLNRESLYELRALTALYPYYQPARILLLTNLYLLHDSSFDEELRRAAMYITDRQKLFKLVEAAHYQLRHEKIKTTGKQGGRVEPDEKISSPSSASEASSEEPDRTTKLIDDFLDQMPKDEPEEEKQRKPTVADATVDYVAYLLSEDKDEKADEGEQKETPQLKGQELIDDFLENDDGKMTLQEDPEYEPEIETQADSDETGYFTETLARIYIKQGRYSKALEIIRRLNLIYPKKNRYFADQIRFLEKLIINNNKNNE